ncbi:(3S,6E)-nerolidol synthase 1-like [Lycium barbarum]|uniref:(3S,6E)-nerolidol synthase 1-like n=1 Tax=Lycium barbarum TaxID=112863 RepID=UPI00293F4CAB|nr:(3S,6E)-nerolidol synthase 1-like [Lycium barbarum]
MSPVFNNPNVINEKDVKYTKVEQVEKYLDIVNEQNQLQALVIIDVIQQLGLDHLFHQQIQLILEQQYLKTKTAHFYRHSDLYEVSLRFRLLRQEGYNVPAEVFNNFKGENESFQDELRQDLKGLMALHEATHLSIKGEGILVEAAQFSGECLTRNMVYLDDNQSKMARQTLQHPIHKNLPRYSIRSSLEEFQVGDEWEATLKDLAFIEFGKLQSVYKEEKRQVLKWWNELSVTQDLKLARSQPLKWYMWSIGALSDPRMSKERMELIKPISLVYLVDDIFDVYGKLPELTLFTEVVNRWEISTVEQLPNYMRTCFMTLYETTENIGCVVYKEHGWNPIDYLRKAWANLCNAFLEEAKWFNSGDMPVVEEYLKNGIVSSGVPMVLINLYFLLGHAATKDSSSSDVFADIEGIISSIAQILRLLDDLGNAEDEQQEGQDGSYVEYLMEEEQGLTYEDARQHVLDMVSNAWKDVNKQCLTPSAIPLSFQKACLNVARMVPMMYIYDENHCLPVLEKHIKSIFCDMD